METINEKKKNKNKRNKPGVDGVGPQA